MSGLNLLEFERLLEDRHGHCLRLLELSRQQRDLIDGGNFTALLGVLGQKQQILGRLEGQKHRQPALVEFWRSRRESLASRDRDRCERLLAEIDGVLARLVGEEQVSSEFLARQRDATRQELEQLHLGSEVHRAYRDGMAPTTTRHLDVGG
ncbi:MAG TPA: hypothetical protein VML55_09105 [Planctomycetaceae bacterium]|nr:hypothetical protein [Planctomycetaceae bacterium]